MNNLELLRPTIKERVYDLVGRAGVNISDWSNYTNGKHNPAANPKYCYNWSFVEPHKVVVLNIWHEGLYEKNGAIYVELHPEEAARKLKGLQASRARELEGAIQLAMKNGLPIKFIICDGGRVPLDKVSSGNSSKVKYRSLDPLPWHVIDFNTKTKKYTFKRGDEPSIYIDQFALKSIDLGEPNKKLISGYIYNRNPQVREAVLQRAKGKCEHCGEKGFSMDNGFIYLETHHIVPLSEKGRDSTDNVIALCPNHHREAHFGKEKHAITKRLLELAKLR